MIRFSAIALGLCFAPLSLTAGQTGTSGEQIRPAGISGPGVAEHRAGGDFNDSEKSSESAGEFDKLPFPVRMTPTRSSFLASWTAASGARGYYLDVATDPAFDGYVSGYQGLDVGMTKQRIVSGLQPRTRYYYRVRSYDAAVTGMTMMSETAASSFGLVIHPTFDRSITTNVRSAAVQATITQAISVYQSLFSDPITVSILFRYSPTYPDGRSLGITPATSGSVVYEIPWTSFITSLRADARTTNDALAVASLTAAALTNYVVCGSANGRAIGLETPPALFANGSVGTGGPFDGIVTLNPAAPLQFSQPASALNLDALTGTEHEIDEVLGLGSYLGGSGTYLRPLDLFSWQAANLRNTHSTGVRYFSINSGQTNFVYFNQNLQGDFGTGSARPARRLTFRCRMLSAAEDRLRT